ncbi:hypothetical protein [Streptomyces sp. NPDC048565]|uniref:hypothetical protein n=1 Tax=Streptomyces sp. NPDC048565 TaxID=3155266 RepID=UPI003436C7DC
MSWPRPEPATCPTPLSSLGSRRPSCTGRTDLEERYARKRVESSPARSDVVESAKGADAQPADESPAPVE